MGLLRLALALAVVVFHLGIHEIWGLPLMNGRAAVFSFFVISGFFMAMVLHTRYTRAALGPTHVRVFYVSRFLRLYPAYALVLIGFLAVGALLDVPLPDGLRWSDSTSLVGLAKVAVGWMSNLTLAFINMPSASHQLVIGPAWSIGVELSFYVLSPFAIHWKHGWQWLASGVGFVLLLVPYGSHAPMLYGFQFFMMGMLGWQIYRRLGHLRVTPLRTAFMVGAVVLLIVVPVPTDVFLGAPAAQTANNIDSLVYALLVAIAAPWLQRYSGSMAWDTWIGKLSYPVYLIHMPVIVIADRLGTTSPFLLIGITLLLGVLLLQFETLVVEPVRSRLRS